MIQGGDPTGTGRGGESIYGERFEDEFHPWAFSQERIYLYGECRTKYQWQSFFIVHAEETSWLDGKHSVFGRVTTGIEVVDTLAARAKG